MSARGLRLVFFGTPGFAAPTLDRLLGGAHPVVAVVTQPERPRGRGRSRAPLPVAALAAQAGVPLLQPERAGGGETIAALAALAPDLGVVVAFGQFLPKRLRELPARGYCINAHASLLPRHRGAAPIAHAILAGDAETGISIMRIAREMDAGPLMLTQRDGRSRFRTPIAESDDAGSLGARLAAQCADATAAAVAAIAAGEAVWREQDCAAASFAPKLGPADARLNFRESAESLARRVRALAPRPGAQAVLGDLHLRILAARAEPDANAAHTAHGEGGAPESASHAAPGTRGEPASESPGARGESESASPPAHTAPGEIGSAAARAPGTLLCSGGALRAATGAGWLRVLRLQRAGGRVLSAADFLRGRRIPHGARLAPPP